MDAAVTQARAMSRSLPNPCRRHLPLTRTADQQYKQSEDTESEHESMHPAPVVSSSVRFLAQVFGIDRLRRNNNPPFNKTVSGYDDFLSRRHCSGPSKHSSTQLMQRTWILCARGANGRTKNCS
jgi:hypothetical protein